MIHRFVFPWFFIGFLLAGCASTSTAPADRAGLRVYKDPVTGEFTEPPPAIPPAASTIGPHNHSHEGLTAVPNYEVPGGGIKLDLQGRFRSHFVATKDADGKVHIRCVPEHELPKP